MKISSRQKEIIEFIMHYQADKGYSPTVREIAAAVGLASISTVHGHLERLERRGYIKRGDIKSPRAIEIIEEKKKSGTFFANNYDQVLYFLVEDDAMAKSKIKKGDAVIVRPTANVEDGSIALVNLCGRKMVRRVYSIGRQRMLEADEKETIVTSELEVIGKVIGVLGLLKEVTE
jgi:repressor LexA